MNATIENLREFETSPTDLKRLLASAPLAKSHGIATRGRRPALGARRSGGWTPVQTAFQNITITVLRSRRPGLSTPPSPFNRRQPPPTNQPVLGIDQHYQSA
jgi:hypothetical protein